MRLFVTGTRGIPNIPGGVERHCENLYPLIAEAGVDVCISRRDSYVDFELPYWRGIQLVDLNSPRRKSLEAIVHTVLSVLQAKKWGADIVHIHAVGPAIVVPLARALGMTVVVTNHGPDYDRQKWGWLAKGVLKLGEYLGCKYANEVIVISNVIRDIVSHRCGRTSHLVYNGVPLPELQAASNYLRSLNVRPGKYLLVAARLVPEKGLHDLITAFEGMETDCKLVIAGDSDHNDPYSMTLKARGAANRRIVMPGYVTGDDLAQLYSHARLFVLPSYHEGLPIALLEALSYGLPTVVSDIPANMEVKLDPDCYFPVGDVNTLREKILQELAKQVTEEEREARRRLVAQTYNWADIAEQTLGVYADALASQKTIVQTT